MTQISKVILKAEGVLSDFQKPLQKCMAAVNSTSCLSISSECFEYQEVSEATLGSYFKAPGLLPRQSDKSLG